MDRTTHWNDVYATTRPAEVSWYQREPARSLQLLAEAGLGPGSVVLDVGGGDSTLVDALLARNVEHVTVLDLSGAALARARARLGPSAAHVTWLEADVTRVTLPPGAYDVWHDRAVFHFLTEPEDRARYVANATTALRPGGTLIVATFALDGPARCSGLDVARYGPVELAREFSGGFVLRRGVADVHHTPRGTEQRFTYGVFERR